MKRSITVILLVSIFSLIACEDKPEPDIETVPQLEGIWILYERGYSPGVGYHIEKINTNPPSRITLTWDRDFSSNINGLTQFNFYRVVMDSVHNRQVLALYEEDPSNETLDVDNLKNSYFIELEENKLKLYFRYCIEGCHMAFKREILND
jgi:hypothetical protein